MPPFLITRKNKALVMITLFLSSCSLRFDFYSDKSVGGSFFPSTDYSKSNYEKTVLDYASVVNEISGSHSECLSYFFMTDFHIDSHDELKAFNDILADFVSLANNTSVDFICLGGDFTTLNFSTKDEWKDYMDSILMPLRESQLPVFIVPGNHDDNSNKKDMSELDFVISKREWNEWISNEYINVDIVRCSNIDDSRFYSFDFNKEGKIYRVAFLDSNDRSDEDNNQDYWGFGQEQLDWFNNDVVTNSCDYVAVMSHMSVDEKMNVDHRKIPFSEDFCNCVEGSDKILINSFGHTHLSLLNKSEKGTYYSCTPTFFRGGSGGYTGFYLYPELNSNDLGWETNDPDVPYNIDLIQVSDNYCSKQSLFNILNCL